MYKLSNNVNSLLVPIFLGIALDLLVPNIASDVIQVFVTILLVIYVRNGGISATSLFSFSVGFYIVMFIVLTFKLNPIFAEKLGVWFFIFALLAVVRRISTLVIKR